MTQTHVRQVMAQPALFVDENASLTEAARLMRDNDIGCLLVGRSDRLSGIVTDRDLVVRSLAQGHSGNRARVHQAMSHTPICCRADHSVARAAKLMAEHEVKRLPVRNRSGRVVGVVSRSDIQEASSKRKPYQVNFLKTVLAGGSSHAVLVDAVYISGCRDRDEAAAVACEKAAETRGMTDWRQFADRVKVFDLGEVYR